MELIILIMVISPIVALISILTNVAYSKTIDKLEKENNELRIDLAFYKKRFGDIDEDSRLALKEEKKSITETIDTNKIEETQEKLQEAINVYAEKSTIIKEEKQNKNVTNSVKEYIDKNNISQGNLLFALGVLFISIAGIVFATTTWKTIPNLFKIGIIILASLVTLFLSQFAKKKFKLTKTSITLYTLFCILISLIPLSMGYFKIFGNYLTIGGKGEFLLYAISLLVFIVSFAIGTICYDLNKIASYLPYVINIELVLIILNFTKQFDIILVIISIYNFILIMVTSFAKTSLNSGKISIFTKKLKNISNNTLLILSLVSVLNTASGFVMTVLSLIFAIMFAGNVISIKPDKDGIFKYIIAAIFIIASCFRFNYLYGFKYVTEYFAIMIVGLAIILSCFKRFRDDKFVFMIYGLIVASLLSISKELVTKDITISLLVSMVVNLIAIIIVMFKTNNKYLKYIKTIYYMVLTLAITKFVYNIIHLSSFQIIMFPTILFIVGWLVSNIVNKKIFKNKFTDDIINLVYIVLITLGLIVLSTELYIKSIFDRIVIYNLLTTVSLVIVLIGSTLEKCKYKNYISTIQQIVLLITNLLLIHINPITPFIVLIAMTYDYIFNEKEYNKYVIQISYLLYMNFLSTFTLTHNRVIILTAYLILHYVIFNVIDYKKLKKVDLKFLDITVMSNLAAVFIVRYANYVFDFDYRLQTLIVSMVICIILFYMYYARGDKCKRIIEYALPVTMFVTVAMVYNLIYFIYYHRGLILNRYFFVNKVFVGYYVALMIVSIVRLFVNKISNITKYFAPYAISFCLIKFVYTRLTVYGWWGIFHISNFINTIFTRDIYILTAFLAIYLLAIIIKLKIRNGTYKSKNIAALIKWQIVLLELLFIHLINKVDNRIINILFYFIIINFALMMIYRLVITRVLTITETNSNNDLYNFDSLVYKVKNHYLFVVNIIVNIVGIITIVLIVTIGVYKLVPIYSYYNLLSTNPYIILLKYIILAFVINISMWQRSEYKIRYILFYLTPYIAVNCLINDDTIKCCSLLAIFVIYYILALTFKNEKTKIKMLNSSISYFAISNALFMLSFDQVLRTILNNIYINHTSIILLLFICIFILQFKNENSYCNKVLYSVSLSLFTIVLLIQDFVSLGNFKLEYYILVILLGIFVADKFIWKLDKKVSSKLMIICELVAYSLVLIKIMIRVLITNTVVFGVILFIVLIISYIIKNYYSFVITASFMIVTAIYLTRDFWFNIAWWAYLLIAGILLIVFATKNEQLKKQNKSFLIVIKEFNEKIKNKFK